MEGVSSHVCAESLQGVSPSKDLLPFSGCSARLRTEDAYRMLSIVDLVASHSQFGIRREVVRGWRSRPALSVFKVRTSILLRLTLMLFFKSA